MKITKSQLRRIIKEELLTEQVEKKLADAITRYLIGDKKSALKQLVMLSGKVNAEIDQDNYNQQYGDTYNGILKVLKRIM
ncbi:MAG: hypothetical protein H8E03_01525 [Pelagibacteraceae bacterium]|nr:hypothetical protein [Pelagibacteraceae bacterium]